MVDAWFLSGVCRPGMVQAAFNRAPSESHRNCTRRFCLCRRGSRPVAGSSSSWYCGAELAAGASDSDGVLADRSVCPAVEQGVANVAAAIRSETASGPHLLFGPQSGGPVPEHDFGIFLPLLLSTRAVRSGGSLLDRNGPVRGRVLEYRRPPCIRVLRHFPVCPNPSTTRNRRLHRLAATANKTSDAESFRSPPRQYSSEHVSERPCGSQPGHLAGADSAGTPGRPCLSLRRRKYCSRGVYRPLSLCAGCACRRCARCGFILGRCGNVSLMATSHSGLIYEADQMHYSTA